MSTSQNKSFFQDSGNDVNVVTIGISNKVHELLISMQIQYELRVSVFHSVLSEKMCDIYNCRKF